MRPPADGNRVTRVLRWFFVDPSCGRVVVAQAPNLSLWTFIIARLLALVAAGRIATALQVIATIALAIWALDELVRGVCPFRRVLGAGVLGFIAWGWLAG